jgi:hypothetical protein
VAREDLRPELVQLTGRDAGAHGRAHPRERLGDHAPDRLQRSDVLFRLHRHDAGILWAMRRRSHEIAAAAAAAAFAGLAVLVAAGVCTRLDRYAVQHLMPWARPAPHRLIDLRSAFLPQTRPTLGGTLVELWTYPASPFVSAVGVAVCAWVLLRRGLRRAAVVVCLLWAAGNLVELVCKATLERPPVGYAALRHSYPSGHTMRAFVLAAAVAVTWRRAGPVAAAWALGVAAALVLVGAHVPSDVAGGFLLAVLLVVLGRRSVVATDGFGDSPDPAGTGLRQAAPKPPGKKEQS